MKLYKLTTQYLGKDLDSSVMLGYSVGESDAKVADFMNIQYRYGEWFDPSESGDPEEISSHRLDIIEQRSDFHTDYDGEFDDQKYGWEQVGDVSSKQLNVLTELGIVPAPPSK